MKNNLLKRFLFFALLLAFLGPLFGQVQQAAPKDDSKIDSPCQFSWAALYPGGGASPINYTEDKECQPYQGPCVAFSYIKAMEAKLNIKHNNACRDLNYSIPYLDYAAYFNPEAYMNELNGGLGIPEEGCGKFAPECADADQQDSDCHCVRSKILNEAITPELCFEVKEVTEEDGVELDCEDKWIVETWPITSPKLHGEGINKINASIDFLGRLKKKIVGKGPLVAVIDGSVLNTFRPYSDFENLNYHSFTIIGWDNFNLTKTVWKINDHWPGDNKVYCGVGETLPIENTVMLELIEKGLVDIYEIGEVYVEEKGEEVICQSVKPIKFSYKDQDDCEPLFCPDISIDHVFINQSEACLVIDRLNHIRATVSPCGNYEYEWMVQNGDEINSWTFDCGADLSTIINGGSSIEVGVRVRYGPRCEWGPWHTEKFCTEEPDEGGGLFHGGEGDQLVYRTSQTTVESTKVWDYKIFNINGQLLQQGAMDSVDSTIDITSLDDHFLIIHLTDQKGGDSRVYKFVNTKK